MLCQVASLEFTSIRHRNNIKNKKTNKQTNKKKKTRGELIDFSLICKVDL